MECGKGEGGGGRGGGGRGDIPGLRLQDNTVTIIKILPILLSDGIYNSLPYKNGMEIACLIVCVFVRAKSPEPVDRMSSKL